MAGFFRVGADRDWESLLARLSAFLKPERNGSRRMAIQDEEPIRVRRPQALDQMSVEELEVYIGQLKAEIQASETEIERKKAQKRAADALFGGGN
jgi:uncharacterized small protein (DUF1192 family)